MIQSSTFIDARDGESYDAVVIGSQTWMADNLRYEVAGASWCFDDFSNQCHRGRLYEWETIFAGASPSDLNPSGVQGICPAGWHIPSQSEWDELGQSVVNLTGEGSYTDARWLEVGRHLKGEGVAKGIDTFGFNALMLGYRYEGDYFGSGGEVVYWTTSEKNTSEGYVFALDETLNHLARDYFPKEGGLYLRCVKD